MVTMPTAMPAAKTRRKTNFVCSDCGSPHPKWAGQCGSCGEWNTLIEEVAQTNAATQPTSRPGPVLIGETAEGRFNADDYMAPKDQRKVDRFIVYGMAAGQQAVEDSGWMPDDAESLERTGVMIGSGIGGLETIYETSLVLQERGPRRVSPFFIPASLINLVSGQLSIRYGFKGPNHAVVTACSTGAHAIGDAARLIALDDADVMVAGGAEAAVCRLGVAGFAAARALSARATVGPSCASPFSVFQMISGLSLSRCSARKPA